MYEKQDIYVLVRKREMTESSVRRDIMRRHNEIVKRVVRKKVPLRVKGQIFFSFLF